MLSFIKDFTREERCYFWLPNSPASTVCRMSFYLRNNDSEEIFQIGCNSIVKNHQHAEKLAFESIHEELTSLITKHKTESSVLDFLIALNNSPCSDCREKISKWIEEMSVSSVRLILFFSNLYKADLKTVDRPNIIELFTKWILSLVESGVVVIICPMIVLKMVPEIEYTFSELIIKCDENCIKKFRLIFNSIQKQKREDDFFDHFQSHDLFEHRKPYPLSVFTWDDPQYMSIYPKDKPCISQLLWSPQKQTLDSFYQQRLRSTFTSNFLRTKRTKYSYRNTYSKKKTTNAGVKKKTQTAG